MKHSDILALLQQSKAFSPEEEQAVLQELIEVTQYLEEQKKNPIHLALLEQIHQKLSSSFNE